MWSPSCRGSNTAPAALLLVSNSPFCAHRELLLIQACSRLEVAASLSHLPTSRSATRFRTCNGLVASQFYRNCMLMSPFSRLRMNYANAFALCHQRTHILAWEVPPMKNLPFSAPGSYDPHCQPPWTVANRRSWLSLNMKKKIKKKQQSTKQTGYENDTKNLRFCHPQAADGLSLVAWAWIVLDKKISLLCRQMAVCDAVVYYRIQKLVKESPYL